MKKLLYTFALACSANAVFASDLNFAVTNETSGMSDGSVDMTITGGVAPFVYSWSGPGGFTASTEDISGLIAGTYTVTVTDLYCGVATTVVTVNMATGVEEASGNMLSIFPNPGNELITITSSTRMDKATMRLVNVAGVVVMEEKNVSGMSLVFDISKHSPGVYFVEINNQGTISRKKIVTK